MKHKVAIWVKDGEVQALRSSTDIEVEVIDIDMTDEYPQDRFDQLKIKLPFIVF